jgi:hypothetical protein
MGGVPQKFRHINKVYVAHLLMLHRIKVSVAHQYFGAPQKKVRHRSSFQCATEIARIIQDFVVPAIHIQVIHSNIHILYRLYTVADII